MAQPSPLQADLPSVLDRLAALRKDLPPTAKRIADFIIDNAAAVINMSVTEVADRTASSEGSVVSLCQQVGGRGFQQVKLALARDLVKPVQFIHEDVSPDDDAQNLITKVIGSAQQALEDTKKSLDPEKLKQAAEAISNAAQVEIFGIGSAAPIAEDAHYRLVRIGINARVSVDSHVQAVVASVSSPSTVVLTISHSGATVETLLATRLAKEAGARTIAVTNFGKSPILQFADIVLTTMARETMFRTEAMTSRIAQLAVIDTLIAAVALRNYDRSVDCINRTFEVISSKRF